MSKFVNLCIDIGNSCVSLGLYVEDDLKFTANYSSVESFSSDQFGVFMVELLRQNGYEDEINSIGVSVCSVVPKLLDVVLDSVNRYLKTDAELINVKAIEGLLAIPEQSKAELGGDIIANTLAARSMFPRSNLLVVSVGTATVMIAISAGGEMLGGVIMPGPGAAVSALRNNTSLLPDVNILKPYKLLGSNTVEVIQSGVFYGQKYAIRGISEEVRSSYFKNESMEIIGTGGFSSMFAQDSLFTKLDPYLVLYGLHLFWKNLHSLVRPI